MPWHPRLPRAITPLLLSVLVPTHATNLTLLATTRDLPLPLTSDHPIQGGGDAAGSLGAGTVGELQRLRCRAWRRRQRRAGWTIVP